MTDKKPTHQDRLQQNAHLAGHVGHLPKNEADAEEVEVPCGAFGYLRGIADRATAVEFRFLNGNRCYFPYNWMGPWRYNPSEGILLKFSGDQIYLIWIRGSNLDLPLNEGAPNLTSGGLQRHRIVWIREMNDEDIRQVGDKGPTVDTIQVAELESASAVKEWISTNAPGFVR